MTKQSKRIIDRAFFDLGRKKHGGQNNVRVRFAASTPSTKMSRTLNDGTGYVAYLEISNDVYSKTFNVEQLREFAQTLTDVADLCEAIENNPELVED